MECCSRYIIGVTVDPGIQFVEFGGLVSTQRGMLGLFGGCRKSDEIFGLGHGTEFLDAGRPEIPKGITDHGFLLATGFGVGGCPDHGLVKGQIVGDDHVNTAKHASEFQESIEGMCSVTAFGFGYSVNGRGPGIPGNGGIQGQTDILLGAWMHEVVTVSESVDCPGELENGGELCKFRNGRIFILGQSVRFGIKEKDS